MPVSQISQRKKKYQTPYFCLPNFVHSVLFKSMPNKLVLKRIYDDSPMPFHFDNIHFTNEVKLKLN